MKNIIAQLALRRPFLATSLSTSHSARGYLPSAATLGSTAPLLASDLLMLLSINGFAASSGPKRDGNHRRNQTLELCLDYRKGQRLRNFENWLPEKTSFTYPLPLSKP